MFSKKKDGKSIASASANDGENGGLPMPPARPRANSGETVKTRNSQVSGNFKRKTAKVELKRRTNPFHSKAPNSQRPESRNIKEKSVETLVAPGDNGHVQILHLRKKTSRKTKAFAALNLFLGLILLVFAVASTGVCWTQEPDVSEEEEVLEEEDDVLTKLQGGSYCKVSNIFADLDDRKNIFNFADLMPFGALAVGFIFLAVTYFFGAQNSDRGCIRGTGAVQIKPEARVRHFLFNFFFIEICGFLVHIAFVLSIYDIDQSGKAISFQTQIPLLISIVVSFSVYVWKIRKKRYNDCTTFKDKKALVGASFFLLASEDLVFLYIQITQANKLFDDLDDVTKSVIESVEFQVTYFYAAAAAVSGLIFVLRCLYVINFSVLANPTFTESIVETRRENPDNPEETYVILTIFPRDIREQVEVHIKDASLLKIFAFVVLPVLITLTLICLFVYSVVVPQDEPDLDEDSILAEEYMQFAIIGTASVLAFCGFVLYNFCGKWDKGCFVKEGENLVLAKDRHQTLSVRALEIVDFLTDVGSVYYIYNSFGSERILQVLMIVSLSTSFVVNLMMTNVHNNYPHGYQKEKRISALSLALLGFEDAIMIPLNGFYVLEVAEQIQLAEKVAVGISGVTGVLLFVYRIWSISHILCFHNRIYQGDTGELREVMEVQEQQASIDAESLNPTASV